MLALLHYDKFRHYISACARSSIRSSGCSNPIDSRKRLRGVCITVFPVRGGQGFAANTRKNGTYVVRHVPAGRYYVTFADELCFSSQNWLQQVYKGHNTPFGSGLGIGNPVRVRSGKATTGIDGKLRLGGEISGIVTTKSGRKLGGICVDAEGTVPGGSVGFEFPTNGNGTYDVNALFPGKYTVEFTIGCGSKGNRRHRWTIEWTFGWLKHLRRLTTRWEYHAHLHLGFWQLACLLTILNAF